jgi:hypothetical protein
MNDTLRKTIFGTEGKPVGTSVEDELFDADGSYIGFVDEGFLFRGVDGACLGSYVNGVVYNAYGDAEGFTDSAADGMAQLGQGLNSDPRAAKFSASVVRENSPRRPPEFFVERVGNLRRKVFQ